MAFFAAKVQGSLSELSQIIAAKTLKKSILLTDSDIQTLLEEEKPTYEKEKLKSNIFSGFGNDISCG